MVDRSRDLDSINLFNSSIVDLHYDNSSVNIYCNVVIIVYASEIIKEEIDINIGGVIKMKQLCTISSEKFIFSILII